MHDGVGEDDGARRELGGGADVSGGMDSDRGVKAGGLGGGGEAAADGGVAEVADAEEVMRRPFFCCAFEAVVAAEHGDAEDFGPELVGPGVEHADDLEAGGACGFEDHPAVAACAEDDESLGHRIMVTCRALPPGGGEYLPSQPEGAIHA